MLMVFGVNFFDYNKKQVELIGVEAGGPKEKQTSCSSIK